MNTSDYLFYTWLACPAIYWIILRRWSTAPALGCFTYIFGYILLLITVGVIESELWHDMMSYDLNGDGSVMGIEMTPKARAAEEEWSSDVGRSFAAFTGIFYVLIWYSLVILTMKTVESVNRWIRRVLVPNDTPSAG